MKRAVCPGSYDPLTYGHIDVIERAVAMFDHVDVLIGVNSAKLGLFTYPQRLELAKGALAHLPQVSVVAYEGLLVDYCKENKIDVIAKGLRSSADFEHEYSMALMNRELAEIETVFILGDPALAHIASSLVKDVARHGGNISRFVPAHIEQAISYQLQQEEQ